MSNPHQSIAAFALFLAGAAGLNACDHHAPIAPATLVAMPADPLPDMAPAIEQPAPQAPFDETPITPAESAGATDVD